MLTFFLLKFFHTLSQECPTYTCSELDPMICMTWKSTSFTFNSNGCPTNYVCSLTKAMIAYSLSPDIGSYSCESVTTYTTATGYSYCGQDLAYRKSLKTGSFPKQCTSQGFSDSACMLEDGTIVECKCGFDSSLYCKPNPNSEVFSNFWSSCSSNDDIVPAKFYEYYKTYYDYYVEYKTSLSCTTLLFKEFSVISGKVPASTGIANAFRMVGIGILAWGL
ncbi:hypothetical protein SteCoe_17035 [Stentor coeruleus]|uniref:Uncharacterized protein n=1 Tax=Stentor coeruleus TaxID=5963 RepID=A0A1R2C023_9CILI|nr:hypothetical protein SteCoe_17035 [Stentor coeruleus]